jgi:hypothetical protein
MPREKRGSYTKKSVYSGPEQREQFSVTFLKHYTKKLATFGIAKIKSMEMSKLTTKQFMFKIPTREKLIFE